MKHKYGSAAAAGAAVLLFCAAACRETVLHDLSEQQANRAAVILRRAQIEAQKIRDGNAWHVAVAAANAGAALAALDDARLVRPPAAGVRETAGIIPSREERAHSLERSTSAALEQTLERLPAVLEARVHLHLPFAQRPTIAGEAEAGSGSVLLVAANPVSISEDQVKRLVASAAGIDAEKVAVVTTAPADRNQRQQAAVEPAGAEIGGRSGVVLRVNNAAVSRRTDAWRPALSRVFAAAVPAAGIAFLLWGLYKQRKPRCKNRQKAVLVPFGPAPHSCGGQPAAADHAGEKHVQCS